MAITLEIVTPEATIFSDVVDTTVFPGGLGDMGVLENHVPLVTTLQPGELSYHKGGEEHHLAIGQGIVEVLPDKVSVITDMAIGHWDIDEEAVEEALRRAEERLKEAESGSDNYAELMAMVQRSMAQLKVKRRRRQL